MQLASTFSLFFSVALKLLLKFSQQLQKLHENSIVLLTQTEDDTDQVTRNIGCLYFKFKVKFQYLKPTAHSEIVFL